MESWARIRHHQRWAQRLAPNEPSRWSRGLERWQAAHVSAVAAANTDWRQWLTDGLVDWGRTIAVAGLHAFILTPVLALWMAMASPSQSLQMLQHWSGGATDPTRMEQWLVLTVAATLFVVSFLIQASWLDSLGRRHRRRVAALRTFYLTALPSELI